MRGCAFDLTHDPQPLHLAIKKGSLRLVRSLTQVEAAQYLIRDARGFIPLHVAVNSRDPNITRVVAEAGPTEALTLEDCVGNTALETAARLAFGRKLTPICDANIRQPSRFQPTWTVKPFDVAKQESELTRFRDAIEALIVEGRLINGTKLCKELVFFAERLENRIEKEKGLVASMEEPTSQDPDLDDITCGISSASVTLKALMLSLNKRAGLRRLVHLGDVLHSVQTGLDGIKVDKRPVVWKDEEDDTEPPVSLLCASYPYGLT